MSRKRYSVVLTFLALFSVILTACGNQDNSSSGSGTGSSGQGGAPPTAASSGGAPGGTGNAPTNQQGGTGMIDQLDFGAFGGGDNPQVNYNPYSPNVLSAAYTFEPLLAINNWTCQPEPWLATDYKWTDPQTLVYTIRDGVKWNDGQPFTADDVLFTFNLLQKNAALDINGVSAAIDNVSASGNQVTFKFKAPAATQFERVSSVLIVPKHVWSSVQDPVKYTNDTAVGTGPFKPTSFNQQQLVLSKVDSYWQADKIHVKQLIFHKNAGGNQVEELKLAQGAYDTNAMFVPDINSVYVSKDPAHNHYWFSPGGLIGLGMNLKKAPFNDVAFRNAMAYVINKDDIVKKAEFGYVSKASQTGLVIPSQQSWMPSNIPDAGVFPYDQAKATDILNKAGYKKDSNGKWTDKDGKPIQFTFLVQNGWTDWIQAAQIIQQNLNAFGFNVNLQTPSPDQVETQRKAGNYDMVFIVHGGACSMYDNFQYLYSKADPSINYEFYSNPDTDKLIEQLRSATTQDDQKKIVAQLAQVSYTQFPTVPLWYGAIWFEYSTKRAVGWPNEKDPYARPSDALIIMTHLLPAPDYKPGQ